MFFNQVIGMRFKQIKVAGSNPVPVAIKISTISPGSSMVEREILAENCILNERKEQPTNIYGEQSHTHMERTNITRGCRRLSALPIFPETLM